MDMGCCYSEFHALSDDRITRETLSNNNPCPSSPSSTIYIYIYIYITEKTQKTPNNNKKQQQHKKERKKEKRNKINKINVIEYYKPYSDLARNDLYYDVIGHPVHSCRRGAGVTLQVTDIIHYVSGSRYKTHLSSF